MCSACENILPVMLRASGGGPAFAYANDAAAAIAPTPIVMTAVLTPFDEALPERANHSPPKTIARLKNVPETTVCVRDQVFVVAEALSAVVIKSVELGPELFDLRSWDQQLRLLGIAIKTDIECGVDERLGWRFGSMVRRRVRTGDVGIRQSRANQHCDECKSGFFHLLISFSMYGSGEVYQHFGFERSELHFLHMREQLKRFMAAMCDNSIAIIPAAHEATGATIPNTGSARTRISGT